MMTHFELTQKQLKKLEKWKKAIDKKVVKEQKETLENWKHLTMNGKYPYYGAISGDVTICFTPTSIGCAVYAIHLYTQDKIELTDYSSW